MILPGMYENLIVKNAQYKRSLYYDLLTSANFLSFSDSDSDSSSKLKQGNNVKKESMPPGTSGVTGKKARSMQSSSAALEASNIKNYHSSPSNSRVSVRTIFCFK